MSDAPEIAAFKPRARSAVSNGRRLFVDADGRTLWARRFRDLYMAHADDLGGENALSEAQRSILRRVVSLEIELERMESRLAGGVDVDIDLYSRCANTCRRLLETLGVQRKPKDVTPSLDDILASHGAPARGRRKAKEPETMDMPSPAEPFPEPAEPDLAAILASTSEAAE